MTPQQLARALANLSPPLQRALLAQLLSWERAGGRAALRDIEAAITSGDTREVVRLMLGDSVANTLTIGGIALPDPALAFAAITSPVAIAAASRTEQALIRAAAEAVLDASRRASAALPPVPPGLRARIAPTPAPLSGVLTVTRTTLPRTNATAAVRYGGEALRYLRATAHEGVAAAVQAGNAAGVNPRDVARGLRDVVGLGESQAVWVANLRNDLESGDLRTALRRRLLNGPIRQIIAARVRNTQALTPREIDKIVAAYADKWRAFHAETLARTVSLDLLRTGTVARARAAQQAGLYGDLPVTKRWVTRIDGRERPAHNALNGSTIPLNARWNDDGVSRDVPGGWQCRCAVSLRVGL